MISLDLNDVPLPDDVPREPLNGRSMILKNTQVVPIECIVRGFLAGSAWKEYQQSQSVCGISAPANLRESERLPSPIFTPATKAEEGHDINISFDTKCEAVGGELSEHLRDLSIHIYERAIAHALNRGILIADTKFEFGHMGDDVLLIDEVLTPECGPPPETP